MRLFEGYFCPTSVRLNRSALDFEQMPAEVMTFPRASVVRASILRHSTHCGLFLMLLVILGNESQIFFLAADRIFSFHPVCYKSRWGFGIYLQNSYTFSVMARYLLLKNLDVQLCDWNIMALHERQKGESALLVLLSFQWPCRSESGGV